MSSDKLAGKDVVLNRQLVDEQRIDARVLELVKSSHRIKDQLFADMQEEDNNDRLRYLAYLVQELEYIQQYLWGFELDSSKHYWYRVPKCTCPKMDNAEAWGVPNQRITVSDCPIHWRPELESGAQ